MVTTVVHMTSVHRFTDTRICHRECAGLLRAGYAVVLIASVPPGHDEEGLPSGLQLMGVRPARTRLGRMLTVTPVVFWHAFRTRAVLYHLHDPELLPFGVLLRLLGRRVVYDVHEDYRAEIVTKEWLPRWARGFVARATMIVESLAAGVFSGIVGATPTITAKFTQARRRVTVCNFPSPEDLPVMAGGEFRRRRKAVIYVGDITAKRGIHEILNALSETQQDCTCILGGRFNPPELLQQCRAKAAWARVEFKGWLSRAQYAYELATVRGGVILFQRSPNHLNSLPNKLFEYMSAGIPIIASDFPLWRGLIETIGCGVLVDPSNPKAVAAAIDWMISHPEEAQTMGEKGRLAVAREYNWNTQQRELLELYRQIVQGE